MKIEILLILVGDVKNEGSDLIMFHCSRKLKKDVFFLGGGGGILTFDHFFSQNN